MARGGFSDDRKQAAARRGAQQMIARGSRPMYRARTDADGRWQVDGCPWLQIDVRTRSDALAATRAAVASWLDVDPDAFDVEVAYERRT